MKNLILMGALLLLSTVSFGQITFQTNNISVDSYYMFNKNEWSFYPDSLVYVSKSNFVIKELNKQGKPNHIVYPCKFEENGPNNYIGFITNKSGEIRIVVNLDKRVIGMEIKDFFTNKISKVLYY